LQAIARVNRVYPAKDFGYIIDYYGVLGKLGEALDKYSAWRDLTKTTLKERLQILARRLKTTAKGIRNCGTSSKTIGNKRDAEAFEHYCAMKNLGLCL